jgi:U3 small nucleolar RNA-associated protein 18
MSAGLINREDIVPPPKDTEELELEKLVFGDLKGFESGLKNIESLYDESDEYASGSEFEEDNPEEQELGNVNDDQLFFVDDGENDGAMDVDSESSDNEESEEESDDSEDAWHDEEDDEISISLLDQDKLKKLRKKETDTTISGRQYVQRLRSQFEKIYPRPQWADAQSDEDEELNSDDDIEQVGEEEVHSGDVKALTKILQIAKSYTSTASKLITPTKLDITRVRDANQAHASRSAIQTLSFHPTHPLLLTSGYDRTIRLYHIDGKANSVVSTIHLRDTPVQTAQFNPDSQHNKVFAGGRRRYMYSWDLTTGAVEKISRMYGHESTQRSFENFKLSPKGNFIALQGNSGWINILSAVTSQWVQGFKIEGTIVDFDWAVDEELIVGINSAGDVWEFSLSTGKVMSRWRETTGVGITKIRLGGKTSRWCAIGSESGIVNVYDRLGSTKKPMGILDQLVTSISSLEFSHDGQVLCIASRAKKDALRLVHLPSCKVFQNWPTSGTPLGKVTSVKFSPNSEMLCIGNEAGKARLWRLNHY